jgi:hypothetical protein
MTWWTRLFVYAWIVFQTSSVFAQILLTGVGASGGTAPVTGSCSQSTAFFGRAGSIDTIHHNAYDALICNGVTDGWFTKLDVFYVFATQTSSQAVLNLVSSSYNATGMGSGHSPTFTADVGIGWDATSTWLDTTFMSGTNYTLTSASYGVCKNPFPGSNASSGVYDGSIVSEIFWEFTSSNTVDMGLNILGTVLASTTNVQAVWTVSRSGTTTTVMKNGTSLNTGTSTATQVPTKSFYLGARNGNGTAQFFDGGNQVAAFIGGALTTTDNGNIHTRLNTYTTALGTAQC